MNHRSVIPFVIPGEPHRRSRAKLAELEALRRELARLDHIEDHVLEVVADRLLDALGLPEPEPKPRVIEPKPLMLVRVEQDCVERTMDARGPARAGV